MTTTEEYDFNCPICKLDTENFSDEIHCTNCGNIICNNCAFDMESRGVIECPFCRSKYSMIVGWEKIDDIWWPTYIPKHQLSNTIKRDRSLVTRAGERAVNVWWMSPSAMPPAIVET